MLVFWESYTGYLEKFTGSHLLIWNLDTNTVNLLAPYGVGGKFSPNGKWLTYLTFGQAKLDGNDRAVDAKPVGESLYMQLMAMNSKQVILSLPTIALSDYEDINFNQHQLLLSRFSPDSRYLAFFTPGEIQVDGSGWPVSVITTTNQAFVNILDLQEKQLVWATSAREESVLSWSPTGKYLTYQDVTKNWQLFDLNHQINVPITQQYGEWADEPKWSYDGRYLSINSHFIHIFDITRGIQPGAAITITSLRMSDPSTGWGIDANGNLLRTADGGLTWRSASPAPQAFPPERFFALDAATAWVSASAGSSTGWLTTNGGLSWLPDQPVPPGALSTTIVNGVEWLDALTGWRLSDNGAGAYDLEQTRDGGQTWSKIKTVLWQGQLDFVNEQVGWAIAHLEESTALLQTIDGGQTWVEIKPVVAP
jgi:hypothetical protein